MSEAGTQLAYRIHRCMAYYLLLLCVQCDVWSHTSTAIVRACFRKAQWSLRQGSGFQQVFLLCRRCAAFTFFYGDAIPRLRSSHISTSSQYFSADVRDGLSMSRDGTADSNIAIAVKAILQHLEVPTIDQIINVRIIQFLEKVALTPVGRLT
jgi:hypothetical protein